MRHSIIALAATLAAAVPAVAAADTFAFSTVDTVVVGEDGENGYSNAMLVTGLRDGQNAPTTSLLVDNLEHSPRLERCYRMAIIAMSKPGRWRFTVDTWVSSWGSIHFIDRCGLTRVD
jgi:hypothetical protein